MDLVFSRTKKIPANRFGRECSLCSSRHGVPIECSARGCKAAYHTTCAIRGKLKMQAIFGKNYKGGIKLRSYCKDHSPTVKLENGLSDQTDTIDANGVKEIDMTNLADDQLLESNEELDYFWKYVDINEVHKKISEAYARRNGLSFNKTNQIKCEKESSPKKKKSTSPIKIEDKKANNMLKKAKTKSGQALMTTASDDPAAPREVDLLVIDLIYRYWMLLRTANNSQSLIKFSPTALKEREFEQRKSIMRLRIELERVRNLSYMIGKREKLKLSWLKSHQNIIKRTLSIIDDINPLEDAHQMIEASSGPNNKSSSSISTNNNNNRHNHQNHNHHQLTTANHHQTNSKKSLHQTLYLQPTNGMFDESDQLINDLLTCNQIYELSNANSHSNYNNLSYQERCTLEGRKTLSLVRRINRQLKNICHEPSTNPYAKSYIVPKRSDSPMDSAATTHNNHQPANKILKYR